MGSDRSKDNKYFNCSEEHELKYVSGRYDNSAKVKDFLIENCKSGKIKYSTHDEVYELIQKELGYPSPKSK